ncbi:hypothetical protein EDB85DRAFT_2142103 [Lactarius pseudohatsudake]|nr:hypothetical protein EDB85DRAFT_2142103 [Lactarius pseudohatsudake]
MKVDVNVTAGLIRDPTIKNDGNNASKPYRYLKASGILVTGKFELANWDLLVRGVLDWTVNPLAVTSTKPPRYGTGVIKMCFPEREEDVTGNIAVKKVINDRLNEWRSAFGKKAIQVLGDHVLTLRNGPTDTVFFVHGLLPSPCEQPLEFPLIYSNPMKLKGSWQAPLLLQVFATHLRRVVKSPGNFGYPAGALAVSTAALESSTNGNMKTTGFENNPWSGIASQYAESTRKLPDRKPHPTALTRRLETTGRCSYPPPPPLPFVNLRPPLGVSRAREPLAPARAFAGSLSLWTVLPPSMGKPLILATFLNCRLETGRCSYPPPPPLPFVNLRPPLGVSRAREPLAPARAFAGSLSLWTVLPPSMGKPLILATYLIRQPSLAGWRPRGDAPTRGVASGRAPIYGAGLEDCILFLLPGMTLDSPPLGVSCVREPLAPARAFAGSKLTVPSLAALFSKNLETMLPSSPLRHWRVAVVAVIGIAGSRWQGALTAAEASSSVPYVNPQAYESSILEREAEHDSHGSATGPHDPLRSLS